MAQSPGKIIDLPELRNKKRVFVDRADAGEVLADMLKDYQHSSALIMAIPAGGVPVALSMAQQLDLAVSVAVVSKITLPWNTEAGYGAVAFDGTVRLNDSLLPRLGLTREQIDQGIHHTRQKVQHRVDRFSQKLPFPNLKNKHVFLVDDGLASGFTLLTAVEAMKKAGVGTLNIAVPTGHLESLHRVSEQVNAIYCPNTRKGFIFAVADAYERWSDIREEELFEMINGLGSSIT
ncbi:MAG: phosphoribosyltransferase [Candidatus Aminicenantes bacterium]|nr:MAG: phosphoribosyltransferase [Candidatus Aminicenantes bacterium]